MNGGLCYGSYMKYAQTLLEKITRHYPGWNGVAYEQQGRWVELRVVEKGIQAWALVQLVRWRPGFGHSRWEVRPADGVVRTVDASKLRIIRSERVPLPEDSGHLQPLDRHGDTARWPKPQNPEDHPPPWVD